MVQKTVAKLATPIQAAFGKGSSLTPAIRYPDILTMRNPEDSILMQRPKDAKFCSTHVAFEMLLRFTALLQQRAVFEARCCINSEAMETDDKVKGKTFLEKATWRM